MVNLPYRQIFHNSLQITRKFKFLWVLGLFLFGFGDFNVLNVLSKSEKLPDKQVVSDFILGLLSSPLLLLILLLILLGTFLFVIYIQALAKGGIIAAVYRYQDQKKANLNLALQDGKKFSWRLVGLDIAMWFSLILGADLLIAPTYYLFFSGLFSRAILMSVLALVIFIPFFAVVSLIAIYATNFIVLGNMKLTQSVSAGFDLLTRNWLVSVLLWVAVLIITIVAVITLALAGALASIPFILFGYVMKLILGAGIATLLNFLGYFLLSLAVFVSGAIISVWRTEIWAFIWQKLVGTKRSDESEPLEEAVPEPTLS